MDMKIAIIGAGSSYTPELINGLIEYQEQLPLREIALYDIDSRRLSILTGLTQRMLVAKDAHIPVTATQDLMQALDGADVVNTQIRVGGNAARARDERICLRHGVIGQETTGAGGFIKALRTIPAMLDIAQAVEKVCPEAWIINYTNPSGIVTEAVTRFTKARILGLCAGVLFPGEFAAELLGVDSARITYDYVGLNHLSWAHRFCLDGKDVTEEVLQRLPDRPLGLNKEIIHKLRMIPSPYLQYFYHTGDRLKKLLTDEKTRGEVVQELEIELFKIYADPDLHEKPALLDKRGGGGYAELALKCMTAIYNDIPYRVGVNVPNRGAVAGLSADAVVEITTIVTARGPEAVHYGEIPLPIRGLIQAVKSYEQLTVEAAAEGSFDKALFALMAHPLVRTYDTAKPLLEELLAASKEFLPQFDGERVGKKKAALAA